MGLKGFVEGGIASIIAGSSTHPLDLIKVRMQLQGKAGQVHSLLPAFAFPNGTHQIPIPPPPPKVGPVSVGINIFKTEGFAALFSGVSATVLRQTLYSTTRMCLYEILKENWSDTSSGNLPSAGKSPPGLSPVGLELQ